MTREKASKSARILYKQLRNLPQEELAKLALGYLLGIAVYQGRLPINQQFTDEVRALIDGAEGTLDRINFDSLHRN